MLGGCLAHAAILELSFVDHVHQLDASAQNAPTSEALEAYHRSRPAFDRTMILLHNVVQVLYLTDLERLRPSGIDVLERPEVGSAAWSIPPRTAAC